jgi:hypothetical protein
MERLVSQIAIPEVFVGNQSINQSMEWVWEKSICAFLASTLEAVAPGISFD